MEVVNVAEKLSQFAVFGSADGVELSVIEVLGSR
jgi:hypothetical protein